MSQIFKKTPTINVLNQLLSTIGLSEFKEAYSFTKKNLQQFKTIDKLLEIREDLYIYYYPCKANIYLNNLNDNKVITILRQFLRVFEYKLVSKEKYTYGEKYLMYVLEQSHPIKVIKNTVISFN
jgi:hypothetical protein